jgi:hypothetical protein
MSLVRSEWPASIIDHMSESVLNLSFKVRGVTGCSMTPSPDPAAHVRFKDGGSLHCVGGDKAGESHATDVFLRAEQVLKFWINAQCVHGVGGFGLYFDTMLHGEDRPLAHIDEQDVRGGRLLWVCPSRDRDTEPRTYIYLSEADPFTYFKVLGEELLKLKEG